MRTLVVVLSIVVPAVASAEPSPEPATAYVGVGSVVGVDMSRDNFLAAQVDGGYRLGQTPLWLHAAVSDGVTPLFAGFDSDRTGGHYLELRGGLEYRPCFADGVVCPVAGIDLGYHHETIDVNSTTFERSEPVVVGRVGLDIGGSHVRFRPTFEVGRGTDGTTEAVVLGVAYQW